MLVTAVQVRIYEHDDNHNDHLKCNLEKCYCISEDVHT